MPRQIYRFEIVREASRSEDNVIYEALDTIDRTTVQLFEWNPGGAEIGIAPGDAEAAVVYGTWVTRGWFALKGPSTISFRTIDRTFYEYDGWPAKDASENVNVVLGGDFITEDGKQWFGKSPQSVTMSKWEGGVDFGCSK